MGNLVYPAEVVDGVVKSASALIHGAVDVIVDQAEEIKSLNAELAREKAANANRVELDKVASARRGTSPELASAFAAVLAGHAFIRDEDREKYASACVDDPDAAVRFAIRAFERSEAPASQGHGVKSATVSNKASRELAEEDRLWRNI